MAFRVIVESEKCKSCEECLDVCTVSVFEVKEGKSVAVREEECLGCKSCVDVCKDRAIMVEELKPEMSGIAQILLRDIL